MLINSNEIRILCGELQGEEANPVKPFDEGICAFLSQLSKELLNNKSSKQYPEIATFAFFVRNANLSRLSKEYIGVKEKQIGRGLAFHIAPSNVPINFAYSLAAGLLSGNACVVKASSKSFAQTEIVCGAINRVLEREEFKKWKPYVCVIEYPRENEDVTRTLSEKCDVRVIWGGDKTIETVRKAPLKPRAVEICFADRYSIAVFDAARMTEEEDLDRIVHGFYNDTYLFDQNACSSPRLIYWIGDRITAEKAQEKFWGALHHYIEKEYQIAPVIAVDKYTDICRAAMDVDGVSCSRGHDNLINRVSLTKLCKDIEKYRSAGGLFFEYVDENMEALADIVDEKYQTLCYYGLDSEALSEFVVEHGLKGIDRIVPIGQSADFGLIWDGYDLISAMSRRIYDIHNNRGTL